MGLMGSKSMVTSRGNVEKNYHDRMFKEFGFPKDKFRHAHCNFTTTIENSCAHTKKRAVEIIKKNKENHAETRGYMQLKAEGKSYIWATHTGTRKNKEYTEDMLLEFTPVYEPDAPETEHCLVNSRSRS